MAFNSEDKNVKDMGRQSGKAFAEGLGVGLGEESYRAITAVEDVYVELESLTKNAAKNAEKLNKKQQQRKLDNLKNALDLELITKQEYYERLKVFRDENLRQGTDAWYKCTEEIAAYNQRLVEETEKQYEKIIQIREELSEKLSQKLLGSEPWLETSRVTFKGMGKNGTDLVYNDAELKDFRTEVQLLENYRDRLLELKELGNVPQGIFTDIAKMSVENGLQAANVILATEEEKRKEFFAGYAGHRTAAEGISAELLDLLYDSELKGTEISKTGTGTGKTQSGFGELLKATFDEVPESYYTLGEDAGSAFGEGFLTKVPEIMQQVREYFVTAINELAGQLAASLKQSAQSVVSGNSNTYNTTYTFNSSKDTTTQQIFAAKSAATLERLRGGYSK